MELDDGREWAYLMGCLAIYVTHHGSGRPQTNARALLRKAD